MVDAENCLLTCYRHIELNPVGACMVDTPNQYPWSSYRLIARGEPSTIITPHEAYESLASDEQERGAAYRALFSSVLFVADREILGKTIKTNLPTGGMCFSVQIESALGRKLGSVQLGRPRKQLGAE